MSQSKDAIPNIEGVSTLLNVRLDHRNAQLVKHLLRELREATRLADPDFRRELLRSLGASNFHDVGQATKEFTAHSIINGIEFQIVASKRTKRAGHRQRVLVRCPVCMEWIASSRFAYHATTHIERIGEIRSSLKNAHGSMGTRRRALMKKVENDA